MKHAIAIFLLLTIATMLACKKGETGTPAAGPQQAKRAAKVTVWKIETRDLQYAIDAVGTLEADEIRIHARVSGVITKIDFKEGNDVLPETVLAEIDPQRYALELSKALAEKERAEIAYQKAKSDHRRYTSLFEKGNATQDEVETAEMQMKTAKTAVDQAVALHALAKKSADESIVRPPAKGVIQSKVASLGEYMKPETLIATMIDLSSLRLRFTLAEAEAAKVTVGKKVGFAVNAFPGTEFEGELFYISQSAHPQTRTVECKARNIIVKKKEGNAIQLRPGMFVNVRVETDLQKQSIVVPSQAVIPTEKGAIVYVLDGKTARMKTIDVGLHTPDGWIEVLKGLTTADTLIVRGANFLRDGMEVEPSPEKKDK